MPPFASFAVTSPEIEVTDPNNWRLKVEHGRQTWHYLSEEEARKWPQSKCDKYWLGIPFPSKTFPQPKTPLEAARNGFEFYKQLQTEDGHWAGNYGGPMFLLPGLVIGMYVTGVPVPESWRIEIIRYLFNRAHPVDGGWGMHIEGHSTVFGTALNYVVLRLLGVDADHPVTAKARATLHKLGGALGIPAWGKFWLSALNCYDWEGLEPITPELWLLPYWVPIHPGRFWCHTRMVYLSMAYIYGRRLSATLDPLTTRLREELYVQPYQDINWNDAKACCSGADLFVQPTWSLWAVNWAIRIYEKLPKLTSLREMALQELYRQIQMEDANTSYCDLGPVNKSINLLCVFYAEGPDSMAFQKTKERLIDFMWVGADGMRMNGTNGTQLWDTAFIAQAVVEAGIANEPESRETMTKALEFLDDCQIKEEVPNMHDCYRHYRKGAWPFSTREQGYTVSDCTAEGLKAALYLQQELDYTPTLISKERLCQAVDVLLSMQNRDGGFGSYEPTRAPFCVEWINPAQVFGNIMIEYSYPECTTAVMTGLLTFRKYFSDYRSDDIDDVCRKATQFIHNSQRPDGGWYGSWGICFTYAAVFALESLASSGETYENSDVVRKGCDFLISKQQADGGWGESYKACETEAYVHTQSQVVHTAWAVLGLMSARYPDEKPIQRGIKLIMSRQETNGEWKQEAIEGVFNKNCMISYPNYKFSFTIWALGRYAKMYNNPIIF